MSSPVQMHSISRQSIVAFSRPQRLWNAVKRVNGWLRRRDGLTREASRDMIPKERRSVIIRVRNRGSKRIQEASHPEKSLSAYLALPVTEYSFVDPTWIQRVPSRGSNAFRVTIPLDELLGNGLRPVLDVRVRPNPKRKMVAIVLDGVTFGQKVLDESLAVQVRLTLSSNQSRWLPWTIFGKGQGEELPELSSMQEDVEDLEQISLAGVPLETIDPTSPSPPPPPPSLPSSSTPEMLQDNELFVCDDMLMTQKQYMMQRDGLTLSPQEEDDESYTNLRCVAQTKFTFALPPALSLISNITLRSVGRITLRYILTGYLHNFLEHLATDYQAWAIDSPDRLLRQKREICGGERKDVDRKMFQSKDSRIKEVEKEKRKPLSQEQDCHRQERETNFKASSFDE